MLSLGGKRQLALENERQVGGHCSVENTFSSPRRTEPGRPKEGKSGVLCQNGGVTSEAVGALIPEDGSKGQGPLERGLEPPCELDFHQGAILSCSQCDHIRGLSRRYPDMKNRDIY